jgi:hypothetical protein
MAPTYTITAADVAAVSADSALVAGVEFDWGSTPKMIKVPASVSQVDPQWLVDHCRIAEASDVGLARPFIIAADGKVQTGTDPITGLPTLTSITPVLQDDWVIETQKTSGLFVIVDAYNPTYTDATGDFPFVEVSGVKIVYSTTRNGTIQQIASGDAGGFTGSDRTTLNATATAISALNDLSAEQAEAAALAAITAFDPPTADDLGTIESNIGLILAQATIARKGITNRHKIDAAANTGTLYDDDGTTPLYVFALLDSSGTAASTGVFERVPE